MSGRSDEAAARVHRVESPRVVAALMRRFGDLDLAEESAAEAFAVAVDRAGGWTAHRTPGRG